MNQAQQNQCYNQSLDLLQGHHVAKDEAKAFELNRRAAEAGLHDAILAMGWFYINGTGVERDVDLARQWYRKSARHGEPKAMFNLGHLAYGEKDWSEARIWFHRAADAGHHRSLFWLGKLYWRGRGVELNRSLANQMFQKAASFKVAEAQRTIRLLSRRKSA